MDAQEFLTGYSSQADLFINKFFTQKKKEAEKIDPFVVEILNTLENFMYGGKKVRGALTVLGYKLAGGKDERAIMPISIAVELMHSALLIHDDFIDRDKFRRGKPTVHEIYAKSKDFHYGISIATIVGDIGIFLSNQLFSESLLDINKLKTALFEFQKLLTLTGYGEILDIEFDRKKNVGWNDIYNVRLYKTAYYTFVMPLTVGVTLAGIDPKSLNAIKKYGETVGTAFQLKDDLLGVFGDPGVTGKSNESDILEGKMTFIYLKALSLLSDRQSKLLEKYYGAKNISQANIAKIKGLIKSSGTVEYCQKQADDLVEKGKKQVAKITNNKNYQEVLLSLADYVVQRDK